MDAITRFLCNRASLLPPSPPSQDDSFQVVSSANSPFDHVNDDYDVGLLLGSKEFDFELDPEFKLAPVVLEESTAVP